LPTPIRHNNPTNPTSSNRRHQSQTGARYPSSRPGSRRPPPAGSSRPAQTGHFPLRQISQIANGAVFGSRRITQFGQTVHRVLGNTQSAPTATRPRVATSSTPAIRLSGRSEITGRKISFTPNEVRVEPLIAWDRQVIGVHFPSERGDAKHSATWASRVFRDGDSSYVPNYDPKKIYHRGMGRPAPWFDPTAPRVPFFVDGHSDSKEFVVRLKRPWYRGSGKVDLNGNTLGQLLGTVDHFRDASRADRTRPLVYVACDAGNPSGRLAADSARSLRAIGHRGDVFAATGSVFQSYEAGRSWIGVEKGEHVGKKIPGEYKRF
jgi:hypothetical protein